jgi:dipeptidyl aminopeptidase/acylaminoacyl peptidase
MPRAPRPDDLFDLRVPTQVRLSPDGSQVVFTVRSSAPKRDGYRHALWIVAVAGSTPARPLTLGRRSDTVPRWSPDGRSLAFLSDRARSSQPGLPIVRRLPRRPRRRHLGAHGWRRSTPGHAIATRCVRYSEPQTPLPGVVSAVDRGARAAQGTRSRPTPTSARSTILHELNGAGFTYDRPGQCGARSRVWRSAPPDVGRPTTPAPGPETTHAFISDRHRDADLTFQQDAYVVPSAGGRRAHHGRSR